LLDIYIIMILEKEEFHKVIGEIYKITNTITGKFYVGQTRSHRLNHKKYRPFGYLGRFRDHIAESKSSKINNCRYLNSSIRKYGSDNFTCEKLLECPLNELDFYETKFISEMNTKFPNGYNLTNGGQKGGCIKGEKITLNESEITPVVPFIRNPENLKRSDKTKMLISERVKSAKSENSFRKDMMKLTQNQHYLSKFNLFKDVIVDVNNIEKYIHVIKNNKFNYEYIRISIDNKKTTFVGKYETLKETKNRAINFIKELVKWQCNQNAGNLLRALTTTSLSEMTEEGTRVMTEIQR
jgi:hypothetical protein